VSFRSMYLTTDREISCDKENDIFSMIKGM